MRILDVDKNKALRSINLYLRLDEAREILDDLQRLIDGFGNNEHTHVNDKEYAHEVTLVLYDESNLGSLDKRSRELIQSGS